MVRNVDHDSRRRSVLTSAINRYIREAMPVASEDIAEEFDLSSATIRNIFAELEEAGYLRHPYTSGGRIPTDKGYRYYVDFIISQMPACSAGRELPDGEKESIAEVYKKEVSRPEDVLDKTSALISMITRYAGIVSFLETEGKFLYNGISRILEQPEFQDAQKIRMLVKIIEEKERLLDIINRDFPEKVKVYIGLELECPDLSCCSLVVSGYRLKNKPYGRLAVLGPTRMQYSHIIPTIEYISDVVTEALDNL
ncbi:MAG: DeoR family transcriptional regulator [Candidatus Omnitrophota bacterium]|nr:DeoR family transcriptional regulator [Candidatus Omnitrophota bacterium]